MKGMGVLFMFNVKYLSTRLWFTSDQWQGARCRRRHLAAAPGSVTKQVRSATGLELNETLYWRAADTDFCRVCGPDWVREWQDITPEPNLCWRWASEHTTPLHHYHWQVQSVRLLAHKIPALLPYGHQTKGFKWQENADWTKTRKTRQKCLLVVEGSSQ